MIDKVRFTQLEQESIEIPAQISEFILSFLLLAGFASSGKLNCFDDLNSLGIVWDGGSRTLLKLEVPSN